MLKKQSYISNLPIEKIQKCVIAGQAEVVDSLLKRVVLFDRNTMTLLAARNVDDDNTWEVFSRDLGDGRHLLIGLDEGGNFNIDGADRVSLGVRTFTADPDDYEEKIASATAYYVSRGVVLDFDAFGDIKLPGEHDGLKFNTSFGSVSPFKDGYPANFQCDWKALIGETDVQPVFYSINPSKVSETVENFRIGIDLSLVPEIFDEITWVDDLSIIFETGDFLDFEVESFDAGLKKGLIWAVLPYVSSDTITYWALVYNLSESSNSGPEGSIANDIWEDYLFVHHMTEDPVGTDACVDSAGENHGTPTNMALANRSFGPLSGYEYEFNGVDETINLGNLCPVGLMEGTIEVVFKTSDTDGHILSQDADGWNGRDVNLSIGDPTGVVSTVTDGYLNFEAQGPEISEVKNITSTVAVNDGDYHYAGVSWYRDNFGLVLDGAIDVPQIEYKMWEASTDVKIGTDGSNFFNGSISDVIISKKFKSPLWHEMFNKSLHDSLVQYAKTPLLWTPEKITTSVWFDAADSNTLILDTSNNVQQWNDKSGNNRHVTQINLNMRPSIAAANQNGLDVVQFAGNPEFLYNEDGLSYSQEESVFVVIKRDGSHTNPYSNISVYLNTGEKNLSAGRDLQGSWADIGFQFSVGGGRTGASSLNIARNDNYNIHSTTIKKTSGSHFYYLNGDNEKIASNSTSELTGDLSLLLGAGEIWGWAGSPNDVDFYAPCKIAEVLIIPEQVSTEDRQKFEGYLAHKWGLEGSLPSDHPYKNAAPVFYASSMNASFTATKPVQNLPIKIDLSAASGSGDIDLTGSVINDSTNILVFHNDMPINAEIAYWDAGVQGIIWALVPEVVVGENVISVIDNESTVTTTGEIGSTVGQEVWSDFEAVYHLCQDPAVAIKDSTGNHANATPINMDTINLVDATIVFNGTDEYINLGAIFDGVQDASQIHMSVKTSQASAPLLMQGTSGVRLTATGELKADATNTMEGVTVVNDNTWQTLTVANDLHKRDLIVSGNDEIPYAIFGSTGTADLIVAGNYLGASFQGNIPELRFNQKSEYQRKLLLQGKLWNQTLMDIPNDPLIVPAISFDEGGTYKIWDGSAWRAIVSTDDTVHGDADDTDWHYVDAGTTWAKTVENTFDAALTAAIQYPENRNHAETLSALDSAQWTSTGGMGADGNFTLAFGYNQNITGLTAEIESVSADGMLLVTEPIDLEPYNGIITGSKIEWGVKIIDPAYDYSQVEVYSHITGDTWQSCTRNDAIPGITAEMDTTGMILDFKIKAPLDLPEGSTIVLYPKIF